MQEEKQEVEVIHGRRKIDSPDRTQHSKRAMKGNILVIKEKCPHCNHHKAIQNQATNSPSYGKIKCSKCKRLIT